MHDFHVHMARPMVWCPSGMPGIVVQAAVLTLPIDIELPRNTVGTAAEHADELAIALPQCRQHGWGPQQLLIAAQRLCRQAAAAADPAAQHYEKWCAAAGRSLNNLPPWHRLGE